MVELLGKCRELGYCDCGGFFGCLDEEKPTSRMSREKARANSGPGSKVARVPYAYCPDCKKALFVGRTHRCEAKRAAKPLWCDDCQATYEGKPTLHMQEVHGHAAHNDTNGANTHNRHLFKSQKEVPMSVESPQEEAADDSYLNSNSDDIVINQKTGRRYKRCPECSEPVKGRHKCKGGNDADFTIPARRPSVLSDRVGADTPERVREARVDSAADTERVAEQNLREPERRVDIRDFSGDKAPGDNPQGLDALGVSHTGESIADRRRVVDCPGCGKLLDSGRPHRCPKSIDPPNPEVPAAVDSRPIEVSTGSQLELALQFSGVSITIKVKGGTLE